MGLSFHVGHLDPRSQKRISSKGRVWYALVTFLYVDILGMFQLSVELRYLFLTLAQIPLVLFTPWPNSPVCVTPSR